MALLESTAVQRRPYLTLFGAFTCWKLLLTAIALVTPSPAYDTSTSLALLEPSHHGSMGFGIRLLGTLCNSLTRWDAIYFTKTAERGYANEQEWAFGWGYTQAIVATRRGTYSLFGCP
jgi:phosphatidylinositol glycan class V